MTLAAGWGLGLALAILAIPVRLDAIEPGDLVVADAHRNRVVVVRPATGEMTTLSEGGLLVNIADVAVTPDGSVFVLNMAQPPSIIRLDPATGDQTLFQQPHPSNDVTRLEALHNGNLVYSSFYGVFEVDRMTGVEQVLMPGSSFPGRGRSATPIGFGYGRHQSATAIYTGGNGEGCHETAVMRLVLDRQTVYRYSSSPTPCFYFNDLAGNGTVLASTGVQYDVENCVSCVFHCLDFRCAVVPLQSHADRLLALAPLADGRFVVSGTRGGEGVLLRFDADNGQIDTVIGSDDIPLPVGVAEYRDAVLPARSTTWGALKLRYRPE